MTFKFEFNKFDELKKQKFSRESPIDSSNEKCEISDLKLSVSLREGYEKTGKATTLYDFVVQKEHLLFKKHLLAQGPKKI